MNGNLLQRSALIVQLAGLSLNQACQFVGEFRFQCKFRSDVKRKATVSNDTIICLFGHYVAFEAGMLSQFSDVSATSAMSAFGPLRSFSIAIPHRARRFFQLSITVPETWGLSCLDGIAEPFGQSGRSRRGVKNPSCFHGVFRRIEPATLSVNAMRQAMPSTRARLSIQLQARAASPTDHFLRDHLR